MRNCRFPFGHPIRWHKGPSSETTPARNLMLFITGVSTSFSSLTPVTRFFTTFILRSVTTLPSESRSSTPLEKSKRRESPTSNCRVCSLPFCKTSNENKNAWICDEGHVECCCVCWLCVHTQPHVCQHNIHARMQPLTQVVVRIFSPFLPPGFKFI